MSEEERKYSREEYRKELSGPGKPSETSYSWRKDRTSTAGGETTSTTTPPFFSSSASGGSRNSAALATSYGLHGQTASSVLQRPRISPSVGTGQSSLTSSVGGTSASVSKASATGELRNYEAVEFTTSKYDKYLDSNKEPRSSTRPEMFTKGSEYNTSSSGSDMGKSSGNASSIPGRRDGQFTGGSRDYPRNKYEPYGTSDVPKYSESSGEADSNASVLAMPAILVDQLNDSLGSQGRVSDFG